MKHYLISYLVLSAAAFVGAADSTSVTAEETEITSKSFVFDQKAEFVHFKETVKVFNPGVMTLTCEDLVAKLPRGGGVESIIASTNVVIEYISGKSTNFAKGDKAVYTKTNEVLVITGTPGGTMPELVREGMAIRAEVIGMDLANGRYKFEGITSKPILRLKIKAIQGFDSLGKGTNNPSVGPAK